MPPVATISDTYPSIGTPLPNGLQPLTPRTFKASKARNVNLSTQSLKISHQKVNIDVDLSKNQIQGVTEITVIPTTNHLRSVKLDCREMDIKAILVNNRSVNYIHHDMLYINDTSIFEDHVSEGTFNMFDVYNKNLTIHQHHLLRQKLNYLFGELNEDPADSTVTINHGNTEELTIILPENLKLHLTDVHAGATPGSHHNTMTPMHMRARGTYSEFYTPVQVKIEYEVVNPKNGVNFVTQFGDVPTKEWHAYTSNSEFNISTSSWVPCIDNLWERNTWTIEVNIPRTLKDIGRPMVIGTKEAIKSRKLESRRNRSHEKKEPADEPVEDDFSDDDDEEPANLTVVTGDYVETREVPHPTDLSKKTVQWTIFNPVCAHHIGWAIGCFESYEIPDEEEDDDETEISSKEISSPVKLYYLPGQEAMAKNTCIFTRNAITYLSKEFGSFPFNSFSLLFIKGSPIAASNFAGLCAIDDSYLYPSNIIEPMYESTELVVKCIATQWSGVNIVPQQFNDMWCTIGIAGFMTFQYLKVLLGSNEVRFRMKKYKDEVVRADVGRKPLALYYFRYPISEKDLDFIKLKSPLVLSILDRRMIKTDKSFGLSRVLPKLFLQAMSGELINNTLSTQHFQYICEKVNRNRLENFFKQWVFGAGVPYFVVTQRFNRKRGMIEVGVRQFQTQDRNFQRQVSPDTDSFIESSIAVIDDEPNFGVQKAFLGPMTIRVHEADGIPYEHIVELKDNAVKLDINYNSKFRRMKKHKEDAAEGGTYSRFGDIIQSETELAEWGLEDWGPIDDEELYNNAFEWIRIDTDFEWVSKMVVKQPDYMYLSQLQYDRDVEAQYEAVNFFGSSDKPVLPYCTSLIRTLMDTRYYYGVRIAAAEALARFSKQSNNYIGMPFLVKAFTKLFCFPNSTVPLANDFSDIPRFFLMRDFARIFCIIRDDNGNVPYELRDILLNLVIYNENSSNSYQDSLYVSSLIDALTGSIINHHAKPLSNLMDPDANKNILEEMDSQDKEFIDVVISEIDRQQKLDQWVPSYHGVLALTCLKQKIRLARFGLLHLPLENLLTYTSNKNSKEIRLEAFHGLLILGGLKNSAIMKYFLTCCLLEYKDQWYRSKLIEILVKSIVTAATHGTASSLDDPEFKTLESFYSDKGIPRDSGLIVLDGGSSNSMSSRREQMARASIKGTILLLRRDYSVGKGLKYVMWELLHSSLMSIYDKRKLFSISQILFKEVDSFIVDLPVPCVPAKDLNKKLVAKHAGEGKISIHREGRFKIQLASRLILNKKKPEEKPKIKLKIGSEKPPAMRAPKQTMSDIMRPSLVTRPTETSVTFKLNKRKLSKIQSSEQYIEIIDPIAHSVTNGVTTQGSVVIIPFKYESHPPRYVSISTKNKRIKVSRVPFKDDGKAEVTLVEDAKEPEAPKEAAEVPGEVIEVKNEVVEVKDETDAIEVEENTEATNGHVTEHVTEDYPVKQETDDMDVDVPDPSELPEQPETSEKSSSNTDAPDTVEVDENVNENVNNISPTQEETPVERTPADPPKPKLKLKLNLK